PGAKIGVLGLNGAGKSTLLRIMAGIDKDIEGEARPQPDIKIGYLPQEPQLNPEHTVRESIEEAVSEVVNALKRLDEVYALYADPDADFDKLAAEQGRLEEIIQAHDGHNLNVQLERAADALRLPDWDAKIANLSGGERRRVALCRLLLEKPDMLLLDEPTNHLDIGAIAWLEEALLGFNGAVLFITHDRAFLQSLATRILELDRGHLIDWNGDYASFLVHKEQQLAAEEAANALFDKRLAQEEVWIRQGIKARRTRNEGRVRALKEMRRERAERRERQGKASFQLESADKSGKQVIVVEHVSFAHPGGQPLVRDFSMVLQRGDRIGLLGANGTGKTTLLKLLLGDLQPTSGKIEVGTKLEVAYFDQLRHQLEPEQTVIDNISEGREFITIDGQNRHVLSYLGD
ncbi:ATP-binding cassette domain-containing protein, partial [Acinetobacter baumannii]